MLHYVSTHIFTPAFSTPCLFLLFLADISTPAFSTPAISVRRFDLRQTAVHKSKRDTNRTNRCTVNGKYSMHGAYIEYDILNFEYFNNFQYDIL